ncbi:hypothetical protein [Companilactobacillus insicii]|uniref:hypothetical protein n=1 Tax=Companilactobacillus insicii TaxID=1732567 RepID=UPI000F78B1DE|nr:hypothetical protein [Companilactobacillus insicii]
MSLNINDDLRGLLLAHSLGRSRDHPFAGWNVLNILYSNQDSLNEPQTLGFIVERYNAGYLDSRTNENRITDAVLKSVLSILVEEAKLIEILPRKVRVRMISGNYHMQQASVYRITSRGIEYLSMFSKVLDAESTVTANISRITEFKELIRKLNSKYLDTSNTKLFNDFNNMISAYSDVMKGMHKLGQDLDEVANDLAFNHGGKLAEHLNEMLQNKAIPAYEELISKMQLIHRISKNKDFARTVVKSKYGADSLEVDQAVENHLKIAADFQRDEEYVRKNLHLLAASFNPTTAAIDSSYDSIFLIFNTIMSTINLLSTEYDHINKQTVDIKELTTQIDQLLTHYKDISMPKQIPRHLAQDRLVDNSEDLLEASKLGPAVYQANVTNRRVATSDDNPVIAEDDVVKENGQDALDEFKKLVMIDGRNGRVDHDLIFNSIIARDEIMRLYSATGYNNYKSFAPFGRQIQKVESISTTGPIWLHFKTEKYSVRLPSGFEFSFKK